MTTTCQLRVLNDGINKSYKLIYNGITKKLISEVDDSYDEDDSYDSYDEDEDEYDS